MFITENTEGNLQIHFNPIDIEESIVVGGERTERGITGRPLLFLELSTLKAKELKDRLEKAL